MTRRWFWSLAGLFLASCQAAGMGEDSDPLYECPQCGSVGPFREYPEIDHLDLPDGRRAGGEGARWLCKWCGFWWAQGRGIHQCVPDEQEGVWMWQETAPKPRPTPQALYEETYGVKMRLVPSDGRIGTKWRVPQT